MNATVTGSVQFSDRYRHLETVSLNEFRKGCYKTNQELHGSAMSFARGCRPIDSDLAKTIDCDALLDSFVNNSDRSLPL